MAGLLDAFGDDNARFSLGLLAAAGPRFDGANDGQRIQEALGGFDAYKRGQTQAKMQQMQMEQMQAQAEQAKQEREQKARISQGMARYFKPGQAALSPLMGDSALGIMPSNGRAAMAPSFDSAGAAQFLAEQGDYNGALAMMPKAKEAPINKLDAKDYTPASVQKFAQTGNYGDLVRLDKAQFQNTGGFTVALDPFTGKPLNQIANTQSPDSKASNAVSWANNALSRERLNFDKMGGAEGVKPKLVGDQWVTAPTDMRAGEVRSAMPSVIAKDAKEALQLIQTAKEIIPRSTGSYLGAGYDQAARLFGSSTSGDTAAAQLKALEGALVSKMPKMSGPQSDKDVALYKQMAGEIGDATIPQSRKLAALQVIEEIQQRHSGMPQKPAQPANITPSNAPTMRWNPKTGTLEMVN